MSVISDESEAPTPVSPDMVQPKQPPPAPLTSLSRDNEKFPQLLLHDF